MGYKIENGRVFFYEDNETTELKIKDDVLCI